LSNKLPTFHQFGLLNSPVLPLLSENLLNLDHDRDHGAVVNVALKPVDLIQDVIFESRQCFFQFFAKLDVLFLRDLFNLLDYVVELLWRE